jgi:hypothetical protein
MNLLQQHGASPQKQPRYTPIFMDRAFTGLYTQRNVLHDPSDVATARFYGGRPDALWMGKNIELTNRLTLQRRPGLVPFSADIYPTAPLRAFSFQLTDGTIRVIVDTGSTGSLAISSVASSVGSTAVYTGVFPNGGNNAYQGFIFQIAGFATNPGNNGTFTVTASTTTTLTVSNSVAVAETHAATGVSAGAVYWDVQNGTTTFLFGKGVGAGQTYFLAVAGILYMGDGVETRIYTPLNPNGTIFSFGAFGPVNAPAVVATPSGTAAGTWQASTWFSTMGLIVDPNGNIQQLNFINNPSVTIGSVAVLGTSSAGGPTWNQTPGNTTTDNTVTWRNLSDVIPWLPNFPFETETQAFSTNTLRCICYDQATGCFFVNVSNQATANTGASNPFAAAGYNTANPPPPGTVIPDRQVTWMSLGNINNIPNGFCQGQWRPSQVIATPPPPVRILEPFTLPQPGHPLPAGTIYLQENTGSGTTAASNTSITWQQAAGQTTTEPAGSDGSTLKWLCVTATNNGTGLWQSGTPYIGWSSPGSAFGVVKDNNGSLWVAASSGTSGASDPFGNSGAQLYYQTGGHVYGVGTIIIDSNSNRQQVTVSGTSGGSAPVWNRNQGGITVDNGTLRWQNLGSAYGFGPVPDGTNGLTWVNVGRSAVWIASQKYYLPNAGFFAPISVPLGGANVNDGTNIEYVVQTGVSGSSTPTWNTSTAPGSNETYDPSPAAAGGVVWYNNGPFKQNSLSFSTSLSWAYSYKARTLTDFYSVLIPGTNTPQNIPPPGPPFNGALPAPTGSETGFITTASPATTLTGANAGAVFSIYGQYSPDTQFDTIVIWRSSDGGGPTQMFELTEIPNIPSQAGSGKYTVNGVKYDWVFQDFLPSVATNQFPGLNPQIIAPINGINNPAPSNFLPMVFNFQRIWGTVGQNVLFSGGPDTPTGNANFAFPAINSLPFLATVTRLVRTPQGIITFTVDSIELIAGGPATATFYSVTLSPGVGLLSFNFLDVYAGEIFFFSADNEFMVLSPSLNLANFGFPLGDQFANLPSSGVSDTTWNPATGYVAVHQSGIDNCIFVADGATGWYRLNPRQVPGGLAGAEPIWSPFAAITGGCHMVQSIEYTPGIKALLVGASTGGHNILKRSLSVFTDNGTPYNANFTMGGIMLAHPGQRALLKFIEIDFSGVDFSPTISYLLNEISGSFTPFTADAEVFDPPSIYGTTISPTSYSPNRYYFASNASLAVCRHMQIKVDLGTTSVGDELYNLTIFGKLIVEL